MQILPDFVQNVSPFLPATHTVDAMRAAMFGMYNGDFWVQLGELALFLISPEWKDSSALASLLSDPSNAKRFERIRLVAASENAQLTTLLTEAVKGKWLDAVGVDEESLSVEQSQDLRFIFRGAIDLLASLESGSDLAALPTFFDRPLGMGVRETLMNLMLEDRALS